MKGCIMMILLISLLSAECWTKRHSTVTHTKTHKARKLYLKTTPLPQAQKQPKDRKLVLDWFSSDQSEHKPEHNAESVERLVHLMELANSFHDDPNIEVGLSINYKQNMGDSPSQSKFDEKALYGDIHARKLQNNVNQQQRQTRI